MGHCTCHLIRGKLYTIHWRISGAKLHKIQANRLQWRNIVNYSGTSTPTSASVSETVWSKTLFSGKDWLIYLESKVGSNHVTHFFLWEESVWRYRKNAGVQCIFVSKKKWDLYQERGEQAVLAALR